MRMHELPQQKAGVSACLRLCGTSSPLQPRVEKSDLERARSQLLAAIQEVRGDVFATPGLCNARSRNSLAAD